MKLEKQKVTDKFTFIKAALFFDFIGFLALLNGIKENSYEDVSIYFWLVIITTIGIALYYFGKRRVLGRGIKGSVILEVIFFTIILIFFAMSLYSGFWFRRPLTFSIIPVWSIFAYLYVLTGEKDK